jgi:hypothetical protein
MYELLIFEEDHSRELIFKMGSEKLKEYDSNAGKRLSYRVKTLKKNSTIMTSKRTLKLQSEM